ncbi:hypothetical protein PT931_10640 [Longispora urticae]
MSGSAQVERRPVLFEVLSAPTVVAAGDLPFVSFGHTRRIDPAGAVVPSDSRLRFRIRSRSSGSRGTST